MSDPVDQNPDALIEGNRVATAEDMESTETTESSEAGYEGEAPNLPLASQGSRDGTSAEGDNHNQ